MHVHFRAIKNLFEFLSDQKLGKGEHLMLERFTYNMPIGVLLLLDLVYSMTASLLLSCITIFQTENCS